MKDRYILFIVFAVVCTVWSEAVSQDCNSEELKRCFNRIEAIASNWKFGLPLSEEDCRNVKPAIRCIDSYKERCIAEEQVNNFNSLLPRKTDHLKVLCYSDSLQEQLLTHGPCVKQVIDEDEHCYETLMHSLEQEEGDTRPGDETLLKDYNPLRTVCCATPDYLACMNRVVTEKCGEEALKFFEGYFTELDFLATGGYCESHQFQCSSDSRMKIPQEKAAVWSEDEPQYCSNNEGLQRCISPLHDMIDNGEFHLINSKEDLDLLCPVLNRGFRCIDGYTRQCMTENGRNYIHLHVHDKIKFVKKLCHPGPHQEDFLTHAQCLKQYDYKYKHCEQKFIQRNEEVDANSNEWNMGPSNEMSPESYSKFRNYCCSLREFLSCMNSTMTENCGEKAAKSFDDFFKLIQSNLIQERCESFDQC